MMRKIIKTYLDQRAENNVAMIEDAEVYGWAVHYYDEDDIKVEGAVPQAQVTTSAPSVPTPAPTTTKQSKTKSKGNAVQLTLF